MNPELDTQHHGMLPDTLETQRNLQDFPSGNMDPSELIESLLDNSHVPRNLQSQLWSLFGKSSKLTFITEEDVRTLMLEFELLRLTIIESIPKSAYDENLEMTLIQIRMEFEFNIRRSKGSKMNERELLGSSTSATFSDRQMGRPSEDHGFLSKIAGMFK
jgi:hypothetical protein